MCVPHLPKSKCQLAFKIQKDLILLGYCPNSTDVKPKTATHLRNWLLREIFEEESHQTAGIVNDPPAGPKEVNAATSFVYLLEQTVSNLGEHGAMLRHTLSRNAVISDIGRSASFRGIDVWYQR
jgi:hypothetical protein